MKRMWTKKSIGETAVEAVSKDLAIGGSESAAGVLSAVEGLLDSGDLTIEQTSITSGEATEGQVLTADGDGGCSWEDAGGGTTLYRHRLSFPLETTSSFQYGIVRFMLITSTSDPFTASTLKTYLADKGIDGNDSNKIYAFMNPKLANGAVYTAGEIAVYNNNWQCYARGFKIEDGALAITDQSSLRPSSGDAYFKDFVDII